MRLGENSRSFPLSDGRIIVQRNPRQATIFSALACLLSPRDAVQEDHTSSCNTFVLKPYESDP